VRPNPTPGASSIRFSLTRSDEVSLVVYNALGQAVKHLVSGKVSAGIHTAVWDGRDETGRAVAPGAYFLRLRSEGLEALGRVVVVN